MFGYVKPYIPELKVKEYDYYQSIYCGLCKCMGRCTGKCSGCTLSYDFVFLAAVRSAILKQEFEIGRKRCIMHPFKKQKVAKQNPVLEYCSYSAMILTKSKLDDDIQDEKGAKRFKARVLRSLFKSANKKASLALPGLYEGLSATLKEISILESEGSPTLDRCAELSGELIKNVFAFGLEGNASRIASSIGKNFGKLIYMLDAVDDYYDDIRLGRFNPLSDVIARSETPEATAENLQVSMMNVLADSESAFFLIDYEDTEGAEMLKEIINNIIYLGVPARIKATLDKFLKNEINQNNKKQITD